MFSILNLLSVLTLDTKQKGDLIIRLTLIQETRLAKIAKGKGAALKAIDPCKPSYHYPKFDRII